MYAMKENIVHFGFLLSVLSGLSSCSKESSASKDIIVIEATGSIQSKMDEFRHLLGDQLNTTTGVTGGRREINWDGIADDMVGKDLPLDFFNPTAPGAPEARQRGLAYAAGGQFRVSNSNFQEVNSNAASQFQSFSGSKTFANVSKNAWEIVVEKAGKAIPASTRGFGAVFSDVDVQHSTSLEFFNGEKSLGQFFVPPHDAGSSFSFLGVYFNTEERITRIRVQHDGILSDGQKDISDSGPKDLVVLDDILYSEPVAE